MSSNMSYYFPHYYSDYYSYYYVSYSTSFYTITFLALTAIISNILFIVTVQQNSFLRHTVIAVYLVALSCADIIGSLLHAMCRLWVEWVDENTDHGPAYNIYYYGVLISMIRGPFEIVSLCFMILIAYERYKSICRPLVTFNSTMNLTRRTLCTVFGMIFALFALGVPSYFLTQHFDLHAFYVSTALGITVVPISSYILISLDFATLVITVSLYSKVITAFSKDLDIGNEARRLHRVQQKQITRMVLVNSAVFFTFVLFQDIIIVLLIVLVRNGLHITLYLYLSSIPTLLNSGVNPIIYNIFGSRYREAFFATYPCFKRLKLCCGRDQQSASGDVEMNRTIADDQEITSRNTQ